MATITVEIRGHINQTRKFASPIDAKAFVVEAQMSANCALIKYTACGRSQFFEFVDGGWQVR